MSGAIDMSEGRRPIALIDGFALIVGIACASNAWGGVVRDATFFGGGALDKVLAIASDSAGNTYVAGLTQSTDFPIVDAAQPIKSGVTDAFVAKIDPAGRTILWSTYLGGSGIDAALGIAHDASGNVYVTGYTGSTDFPITPGALQPAFGGGAYDAFVTKLDANGAIVYSTFLGGSNIDEANAIAVDAAGSAHVAGFTCSGDFPVVNAFQAHLIGPALGCFESQDAFVSQVAPGGLALVSSTYFGGDDPHDAANAIAIDASGRTLVAGVAGNLPVAGVPLMSAKGGLDAFVARFVSGALDFSTHYGGASDDEAFGIAIDDDGSTYVTGTTRSANLPTWLAVQPNLNGQSDAFVLKFSLDDGPPVTSSFLYSSYLGGGDDDVGRAIAASDGIAYLTGETRSADFPLKAAVQSQLDDASDAFVTRIGTDGTLTFSTYLGGDNEDSGWGIALSNGMLRGRRVMHIGGVTYSSDLATPGSLQPIAAGGADGFVARIRSVP